MLVLQQFRSSEEVGVYFAVVKTLALVSFIHYAMSATTAHRFAEYHALGDQPRLAAYVAQAIKAAVKRDEIEQIAMLAGGGVGPFAGGAFAVVRTFETDEQAATRLVGDIADQPIAALASPIGQIIPAHALRILREAPGKVCGGAERSHVTPPACR